MKRFIKITAILCVVLAVIVLSLLPLAAAFVQSNHSCRGEDCFVCRAVCALLGGSKHLLSALTEAPVIVISILTAAAMLLVFGESERKTLTSLKIRLLN